MNAYTRQDLSVMQAWPLERKIREIGRASCRERV